MRKNGEVATTEDRRKELTEALKKESEERVRKCELEIRGCLERHHCSMVGIPYFTRDGRIVANIAILAESDRK